MGIIRRVVDVPVQDVSSVTSFVLLHMRVCIALRSLRDGMAGSTVIKLKNVTLRA